MTDYSSVVEQMDKLVMRGQKFCPEFHQLLSNLRAASNEIGDLRGEAESLRDQNSQLFELTYRGWMKRQAEARKFKRQVGIWRAKAKRLEGKREAS